MNLRVCNQKFNQFEDSLRIEYLRILQKVFKLQMGQECLFFSSKCLQTNLRHFISEISKNACIIPKSGYFYLFFFLVWVAYFGDKILDKYTKFLGLQLKEKVKSNLIIINKLTKPPVIFFLLVGNF
jgi:hypothetical protein